MRVVCFGDSNTYGYDPRSCLGGRYPAQSRWVDVLAERTGWEVINRGENGREIPAGHSGSFSIGEPDLLIIMLGSNDILQGLSAEETARKMERFLEQISLSRDRILLIAPPRMKWGAWISDERTLAESSELGPEYEKVAQKQGISFVDAGQWEITLTFDGVHFDEDGHRTFVEELYRCLTGRK